MLSDAIISRLIEEQAKGRFEAFLAKIKSANNLPRNAFRTTGPEEELKVIARDLISKGHITPDILARFLDDVEDHGAQHIFLYNLNDEGSEKLSSDTIKQHFPPLPAPNAALYSTVPTSRTTYYIEDDDLLVLKQIYCGEYWDVDKSRSTNTEDEQTIVRTKHSKRAVNILRFDSTAKTIEIRIDKLRQKMDNNLASTLLIDFLESIEPVINHECYLDPCPIWQGFGKIASARNETFMTTDEASNFAVTHRISSLRASSRGTDIRDQDSYVINSNYVHKDLNIYWPISGDNGDNKRIHTILTSLPIKERQTGKIYIAAKVEPEDLRHVINRIRYFAS